MSHDTHYLVTEISSELAEEKKKSIDKITRLLYATPHCLDQFSAKFGYKTQS